MIYGGNCALPAVKDADIYIGLDVSFRKTSDAHIAFIIPDGGAPADVPAFKALVAWVSRELDLGRKVHVGCEASPSLQPLGTLETLRHIRDRS